MSAHPKNVRLPETTLAAFRDAAIREQKTIDELANELLMTALANKQERKLRLIALMEQGRSDASKTHPGLNEDAVVDIIHAHRSQRRR